MAAIKHVAIDVGSKREAEAIRRAMADPAVRAFVVVVGTLEQLPSDGARRRVITYVIDKLRDRQRAEAAAALEAKYAALEGEVTA